MCPLYVRDSLLFTIKLNSVVNGLVMDRKTATALQPHIIWQLQLHCGCIILKQPQPRSLGCGYRLFEDFTYNIVSYKKELYAKYS